MTIVNECMSYQTTRSVNNCASCISSVPPTELYNIYDVIVIAVSVLTLQTVGAECS